MAETAVSRSVKILQTHSSNDTIIEIWKNHAASISDFSLNCSISKVRAKVSMAREIADESEQLMQKQLKWRELLEDPQIILSWHALSPERYIIIWCGSLKTVFPTDGLALSHSKSNAFWPAQQAVATYLRSKKHKAIFFTGEEELRSMTCGLEKEDKTDGRYKYYADGVLQ
ncbi:hypothetical protein G6F62_010642 [Rhizopus arrhizus]|nr:hypothetical protein G6F23_011125 [Rhizopus arrhizus]KAG1397925.1 hypothetical protein G6F58_011425 [Rhizopus delemar]KAG0754070.1 hypothetical protein G6F24_012636 [Rhizopus arrhizus]KAG0779120.1 hypothetical protein G6F22_010819 [Rhizopus arrhizus]KAG0956189.1 hypothetical protein G6F31_012676 [Rhizopus arrhizus]